MPKRRALPEGAVIINDAAVAETALAFVDSMVRQGWVVHPDGDLERMPDVPGCVWLGRQTPALRNWIAALNPNRLGFAEFDGMGWLLETLPASGCHDDPRTDCIALLVASMGWVLRFWNAEVLCERDIELSGPPFRGLPLCVISTIARAAQGLQEKCAAPPSPPMPQYPPPGGGEIGDATGVATRFVWQAHELIRAVEREDQPDRTGAEWDLLRSYDRLDWFFSQLPPNGYERCFATAFEDAGVDETCAHTAIQKLRHTLHCILVAAAFETRRFPHQWMPSSWDIVYWTPEARPLLKGRLPRISPGKWISQLAIEAMKLRGTPAGSGDDRATRPRNSIRLNGKIRNITYGEEKGDYPESNALKWLAMLLKAPDRTLTVADMNGDPEGKIKGDASLGGESESGREDCNRLKKRLEEIECIQADTGGSQALDEEKSRLLKALEGIAEHKQFRNPLKTAHHNIASQLRSLQTKFNNSGMQKLAKHLKDNLELEMPGFLYKRPPDTTPWES